MLEPVRPRRWDTSSVMRAEPLWKLPGHCLVPPCAQTPRLQFCTPKASGFPKDPVHLLPLETDRSPGVDWDSPKTGQPPTKRAHGMSSASFFCYQHVRSRQQRKSGRKKQIRNHALTEIPTFCRDSAQKEGKKGADWLLQVFGT